MMDECVGLSFFHSEHNMNEPRITCVVCIHGGLPALIDSL